MRIKVSIRNLRAEERAEDERAEKEKAEKKPVEKIKKTNDAAATTVEPVAEVVK